MKKVRGKQWVTTHIRYDRGKKIKVPGYSRKQRKKSGKRVVDKKLTRFRPKLMRFKPRVVKFKPRRAVRDEFTGEIVGWK